MTNQNNCEKYMELLDAYLDDELSTEERIDVESHLVTCTPCSKQVKQISLVVSGLKSLPQQKPSRDIDFSFLDQPAGGSSSDALTCVPPASKFCDPVIELLDAYHDNELVDPEKQMVSDHIAICQPCSQTLASINRLVLDLKSLPRVTPSRDIVGELDLDKLLSFDATPAADCSNVRELLDGYHDNELTAEEESVVANHLSSCNECPQELEKIVQVTECLKILPKVHPSKDIVGSIDFTKAGTTNDGKVVQLNSKAPKSNLLTSSRFKVGAFTIAAAAAALLFAINFKQIPAGDGGQNVAVNSGSQTVNQTPANTAPEVAQQPSTENQPTAQQPSNEIASQPEGPQQESQSRHSSAPEVIASRPVVDANPVLEHESIKTEEQRNEASNELATIPDPGNGAGADALGISTDEDGLYDIKI